MNTKLRSLIVWVSCIGLRFIPFRAPNLEPLMAAQMPLAKRQGALVGALFGVSSIVVYDAFTSGIGIWTLVTAAAYGVLGLLAAWYFRNKEVRPVNSAAFAVVATLLYDAATGLTLGPIFYHQSFMNALAGQVPFTLLHLFSNVALAMAVSPLLDRWLAALEPESVSAILKSAS